MVKQNTIDGYPQTASDFTVNDDVLKDLKTTLAEKITCRESLNSSGTVSRKTSTASDYTPEHTVSRDSRPQFIDQTNVSFSTESCMSVSEQVSKHPTKTLDSNTNIDDTDALQNELNDSLKQKDVKLVPGGKVDLKVFILEQQEPVEENSESVDTTKPSDIETDKTEPQLKVPQRKISRFLVSPVLSKLDVPKEKESVTTDNTETIATIEDKQQTEVSRKNSLSIEPSKSQIEQERTPETSETTSTTSTVTTSTTEAPVLGPEMINTLEQLKISLDNLKNSSHPTHKKEANEEIKKSTSAADVTTTASLPPQPKPPPTATVTSQPVLTQPIPASVPFVTIPQPTTIYQNAAVTIQPVPIIQPTTTTVPQTVPVVQPTQTYQQPVASVPPLLPPQQPVVSAATAPVLPPIMIPSPYVTPQPQLPPPVVATTVVATKVEDIVVKPTETKKVLENLRHVADK